MFEKLIDVTEQRRVIFEMFRKLGYNGGRVLGELDALGFFDAPASAGHHLAVAGGLAAHSINVTRELVRLTELLHLTWRTPRSPHVIGLLHDICKVEMYVRQSDGSWGYAKARDDDHGFTSARMAAELVPDLTGEEYGCIRHHMGAFTERDLWQGYMDAVRDNVNVLWTHVADVLASQIIECGV